MAYEIRKLKWTTTGPDDEGYQLWMAQTGFSDYMIAKDESGVIAWKYTEGQNSSMWEESKSVAATKRAVFADWVERMSCALVEVRA